MANKNFSLTRRACYLAGIIQAVVNNLTSLLFVIFNARPYDISLEKLGRLIFINFFAQLVIDFLSIYIVPKFGYRKCVVCAQFCSAVGLAMLGILPNILPPYIGLVISILLIAVGSGLIEVLTSPIIEALPSDDKTGNMSFLHSFYCWGQALTVIVTTILLHFIGRQNWQWLPIFWAVFPAVNTYLFYKAPILELEGDKSHSFKLSSVFKNKAIFLFLFLMFASGAAEISMVQWSSFFVEVGFGTPKWLGDLLGPCLFAIFMGCGRVFYSLVGGKLNSKLFLMYLALLCVVCYVVVGVSDNAILSVITCAVCGIGVSAMWPGVISLAAERFKGSGMSLFSILAIFGDLGCAVGPWVLSIVSELSNQNGLSLAYADALNLSGNEPGIQLGFLVTALIPFGMFIILLLSFLKSKVSPRRR